MKCNVTIRRNDIRPDGFKRWTVYVGNRAAFDIEATGLQDGESIVSISDGDASWASRKPFIAYDSRSDSFLS